MIERMMHFDPEQTHTSTKTTAVELGDQSSIGCNEQKFLSNTPETFSPFKYHMYAKTIQIKTSIIYHTSRHPCQHLCSATVAIMKVISRERKKKRKKALATCFPEKSISISLRAIGLQQIINKKWTTNGQKSELDDRELEINKEWGLRLRKAQEDRTQKERGYMEHTF